MTNKWCTVILGDCIKINDAAYSPKEAWPFINYLDTGNITGNCISEIQHLVVGKDKIPSRARRKVQQGDIVYSTVRPNQRHFGLIKKLPNNFLASTGFAVISGKEDLALTDFIYWFLAQDHIVDHLQTLAEQNTSAYPSIRPSDIERLELKLPPLPEQRAIAHILGTLDDKIELNRRMNETLEEMARAIFKSWFVDFDPVRAKMDGSWRRGESLPGMPAEMYDLFPERLVDSELGEIPEGWGVGTLGTVLQQRIERCRPSLEIEAIPYVPIDCISSKSLFLTTNKSGKEARSSLTRFYQGDLLFGAMRPYYHKVCIAPFNGTPRTTAFVLFPKEPYDFGFSTMLLHAPDTIAYATRHSIGSTIPYAVWTSSLEEMQVILPPERIRKEFNRVVYPLLTKIPSVYFENRTLADLRDTLLPKLISGELRVGDAEKFMESVV